MIFKHKDKTVKKLLYSKQVDPHSVLIEKKGIEYKKYREQWRDTGDLKIETDYPTQVDFELNPSCNLKCPMCTWSAEKTFGQGRSKWMDSTDGIAFAVETVLALAFLPCMEFCYRIG